jgi:hypothetical protein
VPARSAGKGPNTQIAIVLAGRAGHPHYSALDRVHGFSIASLVNPRFRREHVLGTDA